MLTKLGKGIIWLKINLNAILTRPLLKYEQVKRIIKEDVMNFKKFGKLAVVLVVTLVFSLTLSSCSKEVQKQDDTTTSTSVEASSENVETSSETASKEGEASSDIAPVFEGNDIFGNEVPKDYYAKNELTMVNLFATSCNPCMNEMPEIIEMAEELKDKGFGVLAISSDFGTDGSLDPEAEEILKELFVESKENLKVMYPDVDLTLDVLAKANNTIPYTFFVNKEGQIVGESYLGAKSVDEWKEIINANMGK